MIRYAKHDMGGEWRGTTREGASELSLGILENGRQNFLVELASPAPLLLAIVILCLSPPLPAVYRASKGIGPF